MSFQQPICFDCGTIAEEGERLDDGEWRCFDCAENEIALAKAEALSNKLDMRYA
jgi:transcription initiation factor TFIIIB Brf1 subunit/transcription initiation factor TFIIB